MFRRAARRRAAWALADRADRLARAGRAAGRGHQALSGRHADPGDQLADCRRRRAGDRLHAAALRRRAGPRPHRGRRGRRGRDGVRAAAAVRLRPNRPLDAQDQRRPRRGGWPPFGLAADARQAHRTGFVVREGERVPFALSWVPSHLGAPAEVDVDAALQHTREFWTEWAGRCTYSGRYRDAVVRSLITLKALTYEPTGGIVAAPTTSLPEDIGGIRNW